LRQSWKILLTLLLVAVVPVAVSGVMSVRIATDAISRTAEEKLTAEARHLAEFSESTILEAVNDLAQSATLNLKSLNREELEAALWFVYRDDPRRAAVALLDGRTGEPVLDPVFQTDVGPESRYPGHPRFSDAALDAFGEHIPLVEAVKAGRAVSPPYADPVRGLPLIALAVRVEGPLSSEGPVPWVIAVELSLGELNRRFEEAGEEDLVAFLVDVDGHAVCHTDRAIALARTSLLDHPAVKKLQSPLATSSGALDEHDGNADSLAAWARSSRLAAPDGRSWGVIVERRRADALARVRDMSNRVLFWIGTALVLSLLWGVVLARGIAGPLESLSAVVDRFGKGQTDARAKLASKDEIGKLAASFNTMADAIDERDRELRKWNEELKDRVEERTRELKDAQDQLLRSQKQAAVGELGAGVAHEINNPLAAVLGSAQLAMLRLDRQHPIYDQLQDIEKESLRIRDIVDSLLKLSADSGQVAAATIDFNDAVKSALALCARPIIAQRIQVAQRFDAALPKIKGTQSDLQQMVMQLLYNARDAMPDGGTLTVRTEHVDKKLVKLVIEDSGQGIAEENRERIFEPFFTTRSGSGHKGMGLAIVHRIVEEHGGRITVESRLGRGTTIKVTFPAARGELHLA